MQVLPYNHRSKIAGITNLILFLSETSLKNKSVKFRLVIERIKHYLYV